MNFLVLFGSIQKVQQKIHNPEGGWFLFEDFEEGAALFNSKLAKIELNNNILNADVPNFLFPGIDHSFEFTAYEFKNNDYKPLKVDWVFNGIEINKNENANFTLSDEDFIDLEQITLTVIEKVFLGSDSILTVYFIPLNINIEQIILEELAEIAHAFTEFYNNRESLLAYIQENGLMRILYTGQNDEYINHKMSNYFNDPSETPEAEFDLYMYNMYNSDLVLAPLEEAFIIEVNNVIGTDDNGEYYISDGNLVSDVKAKLEKSEENLSKEELEEHYINQIKNVIFDIINEKAHEN